MKIIPARDPKQCGAGDRILHYNLVDDVDDDDDDDGDGDGDGDGGEYEDEDEDENEDEDVDVEEDRFQDWEAHCARAFAVEMHMDIWEGSCCMEIYRKCTGRASRTRHFARACASETYMDCHKSHFVSKFTGKCWTLLPGPAFCSSLHNRNAHGHVTTATLCGNLQQKCRTPIPATILCQPAQSKCTWTLHKGHFVSKFT